ncbi:hypothetical protein M501DRAFT_1012156 [Patellaria atrata CBS 101060]|uniref:Leucine rich repeat domain protein n=1 Tax=Patellaria atrata CBS 101060 TaxID=1346257 RepID=A0A9P4VT60_9PEZI|nr:hypothetical protein M501DRAFT_1012156 [Patellaria atrata CBS 101060]
MAFLLHERDIAHDTHEPPSSPPSLPSLPEVPLTLRKKRSRPIDDYDILLTSDPPLFSSDDNPLDASVDDYREGGKRKKQYHGVWWHQNQRPGVLASGTDFSAPKSVFSRNMDSGVWMGSDCTEDDITPEVVQGDVSTPTTSFRRHLATLAEQRSQEEACVQKIHKLLEQGMETVDLSDSYLQSISDATIRPLHSLIKHPQVDDRPPSPEGYEPFTPSLKIFLSGNMLRTLPQELFNLDNLTVLSLRNNELTELPPLIFRLRNLVELNIARNLLRWLPWELLHLLGTGKRLKRLTLLPNPFVRGVDLHGTIVKNGYWNIPTTISETEEAIETLEQELSESDSSQHSLQIAWMLKLLRTFLYRMNRAIKIPGADIAKTIWKSDPVYLGSSSLAFKGFDGVLDPLSPPWPSSFPAEVTKVPAARMSEDVLHERLKTSSCVPSLFEISLRECAKHDLNLVTRYAAEASAPVQRALQGASTIKSSGGRICSICGSSYVLARAEWVEYWHYVPEFLTCRPEELFIPFVRQACSLACAKEHEAPP